MGASHDGVVSCGCCGKVVLEMKCPFSCIDRMFLEATGKQTFCLELFNDTYSSKRDHSYYFQIQAEIEFCESLYIGICIMVRGRLVS